MASPPKKLEQSVGGLHCVAVSDVGMRRASNQDSLAVSLADSNQHWQSHGHLMIVADGMGAHAAGELASQIATDTIPHSYRKQPAESPSEAIVAAVRAANEAIYSKGQNTVDFQGMGTTCSGLVLLPQGALAAHVGDSRVYRLRCELLEQLTFDHSLVWEMAAAGQASEEEVPAYVPKNVITRSLGPHPTVAVDLEGPFPLASGDRFLLCSDGLTGPLKPELIGMVMASLPLIDVGQTLVDLANLLGGPDNITVIVSEVVDVAKLGTAVATESAVMSARSKSRRNGSRSSSSWLDSLLKVITFGMWRGPTCPDVNQQGISLQGKAPYRQHSCAASAVSIEPLSDIVRQLEDLEDQREWSFDWGDIQADRQQAHNEITQGNYSAAVVSYCSAVRRLMQALRDSGPPEGPSDSTLDLG
jgi:protein phosphatase